MNYNLPPQQIGRLDESKRVNFVRAKFINQISHVTKEGDNTCHSPEPGGSNDYWDIIQEAKRKENVKRDVKQEEIIIDEPSSSKDIKGEIDDEIEVVKVCPAINPRDAHNFLKMAKEGNKKKVEEYLKKGVPINIADSFGWTAAMCAVSEGNYDVCEYLFEKGASPDVLESRGLNFSDIAKESGNGWILDKLIHHFASKNDEDVKNVEKMMFCDACDKFILESTIGEHVTSITHQLSDEKCKGAAAQSGIMLGPSNVGYRLMCASGWTEEKGLGKNEEGSRFPIRTILKRNRKGLGMEKPKAKVTHFGPYDVNAVKGGRQISSVDQGAWKKDLEKKKRKEDRIAKEFRAGFSENDSVYEYFNGK